MNTWGTRRAFLRSSAGSLNHPVMQRAALSLGDGSLRRETPIQLRQQDGSLVEGVVDLAYREDTPEFTGWTVVDFKTDREIEKSRDRYAAQVAVYVEAISISTGDSEVSYSSSRCWSVGGKSKVGAAVSWRSIIR